MADIKQLKENIRKDIKSISGNNLNKLYDGLNNLRKKADKYDTFFANTGDAFKRFFTLGNKKKLCEVMLVDIVDDYSKYPPAFLNEVIQELGRLSEIHRTLLEKIVSVLRGS